MKTRPWPLLFLALFQILSPLGTVLFNAWAVGVKPVYVLGWIFQKPWTQIFEILLLMPISGVAVYLMKPWSYVIFLCAMGWSLVSNLGKYKFATQSHSMGILVFVYALQILLALYFMLPSVRRTYLDRSVRWWESKRRFLLPIPLTLEKGKNILKGKVRNISEGGMLLETEEALEEKSVYQLRFEVLSRPYSVSGKAVYLQQKTAEGGVTGLEFAHSPESRREFQNLMRALELLRIEDRDQAIRKPWYVSLKDWFHTAATTGKGLVPDVKASKRRQG